MIILKMLACVNVVDISVTKTRAGVLCIFIGFENIPGPIVKRILVDSPLARFVYFAMCIITHD